MGDDKNDPGKDYKPDDSLSNGPINDRQCQDTFFCILFIANCVALVIIAGFGLKNGKPQRMAVGYDSNGRGCGLDGQVSNYDYIYLPVPWQGYFNRSTCVKDCPQWYEQDEKSIDYDKPKQLECVPNKGVSSCSENLPFSSGYNELIKRIVKGDEVLGPELRKPSTVIIYNTTAYWGRVCLPVDMEFIKQTNISSIINTSKLQEYFSDTKNSWQIILASAGIAFVIGFVYMIIMRYFSGLLTWIAIILYFVVLALLGYYFYMRAQELASSPDPSSKDEQNARNNRYIAYALFGVLLVSFIIFLCQFQNIKLAIAIIKSASAFTGDVQSSFFVPPIFVVLSMAFWAYWIVLFVYLYSSGEVQGSSTSPFATVTWDDQLKQILWYHLFGGLWVNAMLMSLSQFILASSCCIWYFSEGDNKLIHLPVSQSVYRSFRYHFGSLAFGSFILAIVQTIRVILAYITFQVNQMKGQDNKCIKCLLGFLSCYVACFERCVQFLNKNAYIQIALTGQNFFTAAKEGFWLIYTNPGQFSVVSGLGQVFIFVGQLFISLGTTFICYMILTQVDKYKRLLYSPILPTVFCFIVSYTIAAFFMSVYGMAIDSILQCAITDEELMKKQGQPPQFCPLPLKEFFQARHKGK